MKTRGLWYSGSAVFSFSLKLKSSVAERAAALEASPMALQH